MERSEIEEVLIQAITSCQQEDGWANLADIGGILTKAGIKYGKLSLFLEDFVHIVELKRDPSVTPPTAHVCIRK